MLTECLRQQTQEKGGAKIGTVMEDRLLPGIYHRQIEEVADIKKSYQWLDKAGAKDSTKALILTEQELFLSTGLVEALVYYTRRDPICRLCRNAPETIQNQWNMPNRVVVNDQA